MLTIRPGEDTPPALAEVIAKKGVCAAGRERLVATMNDLQERIVKNDQTFRAANEQIKEKSDLYGSPLERIPFLCECRRRVAGRSCG